MAQAYEQAARAAQGEGSATERDPSDEAQGAG